MYIKIKKKYSKSYLATTLMTTTCGIRPRRKAPSFKFLLRFVVCFHKLIGFFKVANTIYLHNI